MPDKFDPYFTWLGIPPEDQPPSHYRLLGIPLFAETPDAIDHAADQRMAHLRTLQTGKHAAEAVNLLNEVARARVCLLTPDKKTAYDRQLRRQMQARPAGRRPPVLARAASPKGSRSADQETVDWTGLRQLGVYRLIEKLGAGGMGEVYKAVHTEMDRVVAVKVLPPGHLENDQAVARFKREIKAVASLKHPNIVEAYDAREIEGTRFLVMEYVEGMDLRDVARRVGPLPVPDACELVRQAALGLQCAHEHGLVHRDIKPGNLMLARTEKGVHVKLLDLGLARPQTEQGDAEVTGTGEAMGTADYMAPEQAQDSRSVDIRADLYSLGCTLYRLIAGRPPFGGPKYDTSVKKLMGHIQDRVPPIARFRNDVPKRLQIVLGRLLAKDPAKRLATPADLADAMAPLSIGHDLPRLYARALGKIPSPPAAAQAEVPTDSSQSSGLTRFFEKFKRPAPEPADGPIDEAHARKKPYMPLVYGGVAAGLMLAFVLVAFIASRGNHKPTGLVIDWPEGDRGRHVLLIDDTEVPVPADGPVTYRAEPGKVHVYACRPGFKPHDEMVTVNPGGATRISPVWKPETYVVLHWPPQQRSGAKLMLDDKPVDASVLIKSDKREEIRVPVKPGSHKIWLGRRGFVPFEQELTLREGESLIVEPQWQEVGEELAITEPVEPSPEPSPEPEQVAGDPTTPPEPPDEEPSEPTPPPEPVIDPALVRQRALEARFADGMKPVEEKVAAWDFAGALEAAGQVTFDEEDLTTRLAQRREEIGRMAGLKQRMIAELNAARPPLKTTDLKIRGLAREVTAANDSGITTKLTSTGKTETQAWTDMGREAASKLLELVVNKENPDDCLAAGLLAFAAGDTPLAERLLAQAEKNGADIAPYLSSLAAASFTEATALLDAKEFHEADAALSALEKKYATTPWFTTNQTPFTAAREAAKSGIYEAEAEKLCAEATELFKDEQLFDMKPLVEKLKAEYPNARAMTDNSRKPSFAELEEAAAKLGRFITVRLDGKGDFTSIQEAVDSAPRYSLIEIQDNGPYDEKVDITAEKEGLTIRGRKGCWPIIASLGRGGGFHVVLVAIYAHDITLERLALVHAAPADISMKCLWVRSGSLRLRRGIIFKQEGYGGDSTSIDGNRRLKFDDCIVFSNLRALSGARIANSLLLGQGYCASQIQSCTIAGELLLEEPSYIVVDSIAPVITARQAGARIEHCNAYPNSFIGMAKPGKGCLVADPQFRDPKNLDYRLMPTSPCIGKASDGGDIGCRYTPEMIEMCKILLDLRARGIIKF